MREVLADQPDPADDDEPREPTAVTDRTDRDGVASMRDTQADAGNEDADTGIYSLDVLEARATGVDLDAVPEQPLLS